MFNIAIIIPYGIYGGAEVYVESILKNIDVDHKINLIYINENRLSSNLKGFNFTHKMPSKSELLIRDLVESNYTHIIYYNRMDVYNLLVSLKKSGKLRGKLIEIYHSDFVWPGSISSFKSRELIDKIITIAPSLGNDIAGVADRKFVVPVGIDFSRFKASGEKENIKSSLGINNKVIGTVARLSKEKNIDVLIDLASLMPDFTFVILGDGPERESLSSKINKNKVNNFKLLGHVNNPEKYYSAFDAFILLSKMEGTPISILEAMACEIPVFSNGVGAIRDIVKDGETGFILNGSIQSFPDKIRKALNDSREVITSAKNVVQQNHDIILNSKKFFKLLD